MKSTEDITNYCNGLSILELRQLAHSLGITQSLTLTKNNLIENIGHLLLAFEPTYVNQTIYLTGNPVVDFIRFLCDNQEYKTY